MAQHFYNWSGYAHNDAPRGVSYPWNSATKSIDLTTFGYPVFKESHSGNQEVPTIFDVIGSLSGTVEVLMRCRTTYVDTGSPLDYQNIIYFRGSGGPSSKNGYTVNMLRGQYLNTEGYVGNSGISFGSGATVSWSANQWYWFKARMEGTTIYYKAWLDGTSEPGSWQGSSSHGSLSSGWVGFGAWSGNGTRYVSQIGIGTGGDPAPSGPINKTLSINNATIGTSITEPKIKIEPTIEGAGMIYGGWGGHRVAGSYYGTGSNKMASSTLLDIDDTIIGITSDEVELSQKNILSIDNAVIGITSTEPDLIQNVVLDIDDSVLDFTTDEVPLVYHSTLDIDDAFIGIIPDEVTLSSADFLSISNSTIGLTSDNVTLIQHHILDIDDAFINITASEPEPFTNTELDIEPVGIGIFTPPVSLSQNNILAPHSATIGIIAQNIELSQRHILSLDDAFIGILSDTPELNSNTRLSPHDTYIGWLVDIPELGIYQRPKGPTVFVDELKPDGGIYKLLKTANVESIKPHGGISNLKPRVDIELMDIVGGAFSKQPMEVEFDHIDPQAGVRRPDQIVVEIPEEAPSEQPESTIIDADDVLVDADADIDAGFTIISRPRAATGTTTLIPRATIEQPRVGWFN